MDPFLPPGVFQKSKMENKMSMEVALEPKGAGRHPVDAERSSPWFRFAGRGAAVIAGVIVALPLLALGISFMTGGMTMASTLFFTMMADALWTPVCLVLLALSAAGLAAWQVLWLAELAHADREPDKIGRKTVAMARRGHARWP